MSEAYKSSTDRYFLGTITCVASDRLITDENGEQFYECMTQEELERIAREKDKETLKTYLFNALSMMDSTISTIATSIEKGLPIQVKILFTIKDSLKGSVLNMDNEDLSVSEKIVLGGVTIGIGIISILTLPENIIGIIASLIISYATTWFLSDLYLYLKNTALHLWQEAKELANSTWQSIMSCIESDERSPEARKEDMTNKIADEILNLQEVPEENVIKDIPQETYDNLINLLCQQKANAGDIHQYLECSQCIVYSLDSNNIDNTESTTQDISLHTAPNTIPIHLQAQCINHNNEPLANKEIYAFSMDIGHFVERVLSDDKGMIECNNILVYDNGSLSQVYFVLKQLGLDEEQKITHIQISPRLDISPVYKKQGSLEGIKTLHFTKDIPKHIAQHDMINAQVRVNAIHKIDTIQAHNTTQWAIPLSLKAEYVIKDKTKDIKEAQSLIAQYRHNTKWGYMVFEKHQNIHKELQKQGIMLSPTQLNAQGESLSIPIKKDWEGKNIAIFAYLKTPSKSVRYDINHYKAMPLSLRYNGKSLDLLSYGQILKSYKLSQTKNEYMRGHGHIELEQGIDTTPSLSAGTYKIATLDIQSALILTSNKHRIDTPHLLEEYSPLAFECMDTKERFYISYNANHNNLNLIEYETLQRPINLKSPQIKEHIKIFLESREFFEDLASIHTTMQNKGLDSLVLEVEEGVSEKLSKYFTISDVTKTNQKTAHFSNTQLIELNKKEAMILENYKKLQSLALNCDKIVDWIGYKPNVNSGVRVDAVNENLPNSSKKGKSQHTKCEAFDLGFNSKSDLKKVYLAIRNNQIPNLDNQVFSQVILEKFSSSTIGWLHVGLKTPTWTRGTEFKISYNGSSYINFDGTQAMIDKF